MIEKCLMEKACKEQELIEKRQKFLYLSKSWKNICVLFVCMVLCFWGGRVHADSLTNVENDVFGNSGDVKVNYVEGYTKDLIYSGGEDSQAGKESFVSKSLKGVVIEASEAFDYDNGYSTAKAQRLKVKITDKCDNGQFYGTIYDMIYYLEDDYNSSLPLYAPLKVKDSVHVYANFENGQLVGEAAVEYYDKTGWLILILCLFGGAILLIGGMKGLKALISLVLTVALIFWILIPGILEKQNPLILTIFVCSLTILITFLIVSGFHKKTFAAIMGTISGVVVAGLIGAIFSNAMLLTGVNEHARMLSVSPKALENMEEGSTKMFDFTGIMLSGIMISALGACMDVGMSIASSLSELKKENPAMTKGRLIKSGMNIGKDVMGTMTNTLILAYVGSALCCILLYAANDMPLVTVLNQEEISMELLKSLAGSIGLVFTIPLTAVISGLIMGSDFSNSEKKKIANEKSFIKRKQSHTDEEVKIKYFNG